MADFSLKQDDTWPPLNATLSDANGPINLTAATSVTLLMKPTGGGSTISGTCTIISAAAGTIRYTWVTGNTAVAGTYQLEFEILWNDGKIGTVPNEGYKVVEILADLN